MCFLFLKQIFAHILFINWSASPVEHCSEIGVNLESREAGVVAAVHCIIIHPSRSHKVHLISLLQIQDYTEARGTSASIICPNNKRSIHVEIPSDALLIIVEGRAQLVGSVLRSDEFPVIGVAAVVNVAASDVGDDSVEFYGLTVCEASVLTQTDREGHIWCKEDTDF